VISLNPQIRTLHDEKEKMTPSQMMNDALCDLSAASFDKWNGSADHACDTRRLGVQYRVYTVARGMLKRVPEIPFCRFLGTTFNPKTRCSSEKEHLVFDAFDPLEMSLLDPEYAATASSPLMDVMSDIRAPWIDDHNNSRFCTRQIGANFIALLCSA
jgi:hypothetical protein